MTNLNDRHSVSPPSREELPDIVFRLEIIALPQLGPSIAFCTSIISNAAGEFGVNMKLRTMPELRGEVTEPAYPLAFIELKP